MKKILMTLAAVLCCAMTTTVFTACGSDDDDSTKTFSYGIYFDNVTYATQGGEPNMSEWIAAVTGAYKAALGVTSDKFTKTGKEAECDKQVYEACKKAESTVATIKGISATVLVINNTTDKTVYTYHVQP